MEYKIFLGFIFIHEINQETRLSQFTLHVHVAVMTAAHTHTPLFGHCYPTTLPENTG